MTANGETDTPIQLLSLDLHAVEPTKPTTETRNRLWLSSLRLETRARAC